ncbi:MAG: endolytic transglycosylase MltG [Oligoflexus sp.]
MKKNKNGVALLLRLFRFFAVIAVISVGCGLFGLYHLHRWGETLVQIDEPQDIHLSRGTNLAELAGVLENHGVIDNAFKFKLWTRLKGKFHLYQAGHYRFEGDVSPQIVNQRMVEGEIYTPIVLQYVIPEGFTIRQVVDRLVARNVGSFQELWQLAHDREFIASLGLGKAKSLEGYIYPATYAFHVMPSHSHVLRHMVESFWAKLPAGYEENIKNLGISLHEAVTFASLIERETSIEDEKPMVAEVIWSRLKAGEPLGIDASVIYGIKDYQGIIRWKHLRDRSNPYNSRIHKGLPPGPIGSVSRSSLQAILNPTNEGYYYYVLLANSGGRHHFSKTLEEHNRYVRLLVEAQRGASDNSSSKEQLSP